MKTKVLVLVAALLLPLGVYSAVTYAAPTAAVAPAPAGQNNQGAGGTGCLTCHPRAAGQSVHQPYADGACTTCHTPHDKTSPSQLTKPVNALCTSCHSWSEGKGSHPVNSEVTCLSCHTAHVSHNPKLLARVRDDLCIGCHEF